MFLPSTFKISILNVKSCPVNGLSRQNLWITGGSSVKVVGPSVKGVGPSGKVVGPSGKVGGPSGKVGGLGSETSTAMKYPLSFFSTSLCELTFIIVNDSNSCLWVVSWNHSICCGCYGEHEGLSLLQADGVVDNPNRNTLCGWLSRWEHDTQISHVHSVIITSCRMSIGNMMSPVTLVITK